MKLPLPISSAISSMQWPLSSPSHPMYYEPLISLKTLRQPNSIPSTIKPIIERGPLESVDDLVSAVVTNPDDAVSRLNCKHHTMIALALIFLGNGLPDEAHDLITPLSWSEDTYFGGQTLCAQADDSVVAMASYAHSLLHRREGFAQGEFGMIGYQNANYWASASRTKGEHCLCDDDGLGLGLPLKQVRESVIASSKDFGVEAEKWCNKHIIEEGGHEDDEYWETRALHELCATVSRDDNASTDLKGFAETAAEVELKVLLNCCLERAGFEVQVPHNSNTCVEDNTQPSIITETTEYIASIPSHSIDDDLAQSICNKVSSAHVGGFQSSNSITIRRVVQSFESINDSNINISLSAAVGISCRLLGSPGVKLLSTVETNLVHGGSIQVIVPMEEDESESIQFIESLSEKFGSSFYGGGPLAKGDAFAFLLPTETQTQTHFDGFYIFVPCDPSDDNAIFCDRFHGSRGNTPTSVLQWSKGTIHRTS